MRPAALGLIIALASVAPVSPMEPPTFRSAGSSQDSRVRPTFKSGVERVTVAAVVRTRAGRPVTDLTRDDFEVVDQGESRPILDFHAEPAPAALALLVDSSGSMNVAAKLSGARAAAGHLVAWLTPDTDCIGLYAFDTHLIALTPMAPAPGDVLHALALARPFGSTSLYDAIADAARQLAGHDRKRRALVVLTDGRDNSSRLTADDVARLSSDIDVPVYLVVVASPLDREGRTESEDRDAVAALRASRLGQLAHGTGGEVFLASSPSHTSQAAQQIVAELHQQYFISFAPDNSRPGWHPIDVRTRQKDLVVRARSGYVSQPRSNSQD